MSNLRSRLSYTFIRICSIAAASIVMLCVALPQVHAQDSDELRHEIEEYLSYTLGRWESETTYFNNDGAAIREEIEGFGEEVMVENRLNLHTSYNADGTVNKAFRFYSAEDDKFYLIDVTHDGTWWVISGKRGEHVMYSEEKNRPDGRTLIFKITHYNIEPEAFEAIMEMSYDSGKTWSKRVHQRYRKIGDNPEKL